MPSLKLFKHPWQVSFSGSSQPRSLEASLAASEPAMSVLTLPLLPAPSPRETLLSPLRDQLLFTGLFLPNLESQPFPGAVPGRPRPGAGPQRKSVQSLFPIVSGQLLCGAPNTADSLPSSPFPAWPQHQPQL